MREQNNEIFFFIFLIFSFKFNFNFVNFFLCSPFFIWKFLKYFSVNFLLRVLKHLLFFSTEFLVPFFMYIAWRTKEDKKKVHCISVWLVFCGGWDLFGWSILTRVCFTEWFWVKDFELNKIWKSVAYLRMSFKIVKNTLKSYDFRTFFLEIVEM